ncbi:MAG: leucyl aminopeptidase [Planctomycetes bacterium]|nr:leucyl aminopeptidase [Planctomycetota bacterium]
MAKEIINVTVTARKANAIEVKADVLAVGVFSDDKTNKLCKAIDKKVGGAIEKLKKLGDFKAGVKETAIIYGDGKIAAKRVLLVGLGKKKELKAGDVRNAAAMSVSKAVGLKAKTIVIAISEAVGKKIDGETAGQVMAEGAYFGSYRYDEFVGKGDDDRLGSLKASIVDGDAAKARQISKGVKAGVIIGQVQSFARTIANRPGNVINPKGLAEIAKKVARGTPGLSCTVFDDKQLKQKKMGGILAVGAGSSNKPRMIVLKYTSKKKTSKKIGLVGKAITFDSGGISIKPSAGMQDMKFDKSGGVGVLGAMKAIAELKPAVNVIGIIPSAENMPSGAACRPGDIITSYSGKTIEVQNTDAEGRLILCDGLHYAVQQKCDCIVDMATLTGACMVALGKYMAGLMSNDDELVKKLQKASEQSGEKVWHLPCGDEYSKEIKSKIADLKNIGSRWGGASTAGSFLREFVGDTKWAHIDMAGVDMFDSASEFGSVGSTGFGVRLLTNFVLNEAKK